MNTVDEIPVRVLHVLEADIPQDTRVVEKHIDTAKVLDGSLDDSLAVLDAVIVGDSLAAGGPDLIDNDICGLRTVSGCPQILNEYISPLLTCPRRCENHRGRSRRR